MKERPKVLLDVDGVLANFVSHYLKHLHELTGVQRHPDEITTWEIKESLHLPEETARAMSRLIKTEGWCASIPLLPGAIEGVEALRELADVHVITSPWDGPYWEPERAEYLNQHFGFELDEITQTHQKQEYHGDFIVDDKYVTLVKWGAKHPNGRPVLWSTPHNLTDPDEWRVTGWEELLNLVAMWEKP